MITPSKFISFEQSVLAKLPMLMGKQQIKVIDLYCEAGGKFEDVDEFIYALDVLYILDKIEIDFSNGTVTYAA